MYVAESLLEFFDQMSFEGVEYLELNALACKQFMNIYSSSCKYKIIGASYINCILMFHRKLKLHLSCCNGLLQFGLCNSPCDVYVF